jgi:hypothetical protein
MSINDNSKQLGSIKTDGTLRRKPRLSLGVNCLIIFLFQIVTINFNGAWDYIQNVSGGALISDWSSPHMFRGFLFFGFISVLAEVINYSLIINMCYVIFPVIIFFFYSKLTYKRSALWLIVYFNFIILGQNGYLLKMMVAQSVLLGVLVIINQRRPVFHTLALPLLFHVQAAVAMLGSFHSYNRLIVACFVAFITVLILDSLETVFPQLLIVIEAVRFSTVSLEFEDFNKIGLLLIFTYMTISLLSLGKWKDKVTRIIERIIDSSLIIALIFLTSSATIVSNRVIDFIWLLILVYLGRIPLTVMVRRTIIIPLFVLSTLWAVPFYVTNILKF